MQLDTDEIEPSHFPERRLIVIVVQPGEDPEIESDPPRAFATYEIVAALNRAVEILEEEDIMDRINGDEEDE